MSSASFVRMKLGTRLLGLGLLSTAAACTGSDVVDEPGTDSLEVRGEAPKLCAAVRGNGHYIVTHFASLARIVEHYGVVDGIAGGSSGSLSAFIYESIRKNPAAAQCGGAPCSPEELAPRVSLLLKSLEGYGQTVAASDEGIAIANLVGVAARLRQEVEARGLESLTQTDVALAAVKLREILAIPEVRGLVNPEVLAMLQDTEHLELNVREIYTSIATLGAFSVDDNRLFFRTGILSWDALGLLFGRVADFYAGYTPANPEATSAWLDACAGAAVGKPWNEAAALPFTAPDGTASTCGAAFGKLASDYRSAARSTNAIPKRLTERVGDASPVRKLISTSVLEGDAVGAYEASLAAYRSGAHPTGNIPMSVSFDDVKFGYWGAQRDTDAVLASAARATDLKTKKATSLGNATWREILKASPAEPGLSRFVGLPDGRLSAGGWSDLAPTIVLESMGCEKIVYVTREGDESQFATKIAKHLGMGEADWKALYDLGDPSSSYNAALQAADAVWCTDWNAFGDLQQAEMAAASWSAPLETRPSFRGVRALAPYANTTPRTGKVGCTPGVSGGAQYPR